MKAKLLIKTTTSDDYKDLSEKEYKQILSNAILLEDFDYNIFLSTNFLKAKKDLENFDFSKANIRETDAFNIIFNALNSIVTNLYLWEAYLRKNYFDYEEIFSSEEKKKEQESKVKKKGKRYIAKSCLALKDSEYYDKDINYTITKTLRNRADHFKKPYSDIIYYDDFSRHFVVYVEDFLEDRSLSTSARKHAEKAEIQYFDVVDIIKYSFKILEDLNVFIYNKILSIKWASYYDARLTLKEFLPSDYLGAHLIWLNEKYPDDHILKVGHKAISTSAMKGILHIASGTTTNKC